MLDAAGSFASQHSVASLRRRAVAHHPSSSRPSPVPLDAIVSYIRSNLARRITLDEIAGVAELSVFQLVRAFRREWALTPYGLVLDMRIEHAKVLLAHGVSIADAAYGAGFSDQSHLTRHFRRRTGTTPKKFLAAIRPAR